jgi:hypothetical protein
VGARRRVVAPASRPRPRLQRAWLPNWSYAGFCPAATRQDQGSPAASQPTKMRWPTATLIASPRHSACGSGAGMDGMDALTPRQPCRVRTQREKAANSGDSWETMQR